MSARGRGGEGKWVVEGEGEGRRLVGREGEERRREGSARERRGGTEEKWREGGW